MPELPEVETIRRQLSQKIVGKKLNGKRINGLRRRAKILIIDFNNGSSLVFHLKLTGQLIYNKKPSRFTRKVFNFDDGSRLIFNDVRKFGWWKMVKNTKEIEQNFGPEALEIDFITFSDLLGKRPNAKIKPLLMDQKFIAGIGNIYSDEILFASKVHPLRQAKTLGKEEIKLIYQNIKKILKEAIKRHGSSVQSYLDAYGQKGDYVKYHKVYQKEGEKCPRRDRGIIQRIKIGGRSSRFCPRCQPFNVVQAFGSESHQDRRDKKI
ncbi:MAG: DNA-formamidopyrimidine glycosylase [Candidatus Nealsonbacteria bacterium]|nr:DNA-formamidopyrimidine glycosylase [Candidatus Nealsonbacteria bacterium]